MKTLILAAAFLWGAAFSVLGQSGHIGPGVGYAAQSGTNGFVIRNALSESGTITVSGTSILLNGVAPGGGGTIAGALDFGTFFDGTNNAALMADSDGNGNNIASTYQTQAAVAADSSNPGNALNATNASTLQCFTGVACITLDGTASYYPHDVAGTLTFTQTP